MSYYGDTSSFPARIRPQAASTLSFPEQGSTRPEFPSSPEDAKRHIDSISYGKRQYIGNKMVEGLLNLYVHNADDALYGDNEPRVYIRYDTTKRTFLIESNELGFRRADVESICSMAESTKKREKERPADSAAATTETSIGEKGLGFKSVFLAADKVWISSGYYSFRFDGETPVGQIQPIWDDYFPGWKTAGFTAKVLHIPDRRGADPMDALVQDIKALQALDLLFLRKVKRIDIEDITQKHMGTASRTRLRVGPVPKIPNILTPVRVYKDGAAESFVVFRYRVTELPRTPGRSSTTSDIVLAFSDNDPASKDPPTRHTYAYLPISNYGFKFVIHADFTLVGSREETQDTEWNEKLAGMIPRAFAAAVCQFRFRQDLQYTWPRFLPFHEPRTKLFQNFAEKTVEALSEERVLEDFKGAFFCPGQLWTVPEAFRDKKGDLLLPPKYSPSHLISECYPVDARQSLERLGVRPLSGLQFLAHLGEFISKARADYQNMPPAWHDRLCEILLSLPSEFQTTIDQLDLMPLRNGSWVSSQFGYLYYSADNNRSPFPTWIPAVGEIDLGGSHMSSGNRIELFRKLGVKECKMKELCHLIVSEATKFASVQNLDLQEMVSFLVFLHEAGWEPASLDEVPDLWCCADDGEKYPMSQLYLNCKLEARKPKENVSALHDENMQTIRFVHHQYVDTFQELHHGLRWLVDGLKMRRLLRIATPSSDGRFVFHSDFEALLETNPLLTLELLRDSWDFYSSWFVEKETEQSTPAALSEKPQQDAPESLTSDDRQYLRQLMSAKSFLCHGGFQEELQVTYLPTESLLALCDTKSFKPCDDAEDICKTCSYALTTLRRLQRQQPCQGYVPTSRFLRVREPNLKSWGFLRNFGVIVGSDTSYFINLLLNLRGTEVTHQQMKDLYGRLQKSSLGEDEEEKIRECFEEADCIYVPTHNLSGPGEGAWHGMQSLVWQGPDCLQHVPRLCDFYGDQYALFRRILDIPDSSLRILEIEASHLNVVDLDHVLSVLLAISDLMELRVRISLPIQDFRSCPMFPVIPKGGSGESDAILMAESDEWCIADLSQLRDAFLGMVNMAVFPAETFKKMPGLVSLLNLRSRFMSPLIRLNYDDIVGHEWLDSYTKSVRSKARLISRLISIPTVAVEADRSKATILEMLKNIEIFQAEKIIQQYKLVYSLRTFYGRKTSSQASLDISNQGGDKKKLVVHIIDENGALAEGFVPSQLTQLLAEFCGIMEAQKIALLAQILTQNNLKLIELDLKQCGLNDDLNDGFVGAELADDKPQVKGPEQAKGKAEPQSMAKEAESAALDCPGGEKEDKIRTAAVENDLSGPATTIEGLEKTTSSDQATLQRAGSAQSGDNNVKSPKYNYPWLNEGATDYDRAAEAPQRRSSEPSERGFLSMSQGVFRTSSPYLVFLGENTRDTTYYGELYMSRFLTSFLHPGAYNPDVDWTSPMRQRNGHGPYKPREDDSTFRIQENGRGKLRGTVIEKNGLDNDSLPDSCTFHIQVCTTRSGRHALFDLSRSQVEKAVFFHAKLMRPNAKSGDVYIIAHVYSVHSSDPGIALYVDPWGLHERGLLTLEPSSCEVGISPDTPALWEESRKIADLGADGPDIYRDLPVDNKHIRLLELEIGGETDDNTDRDNTPLRAKLVCTALHPLQTRFWAISYVWGPPPTKDGHVIEVNGVAVPITDSLWACLRRLRASYRATGDRVLLWADAICINQKDEVEKAMQVRQMGTFYSKADKVVIWTGNEARETRGALQSLEQWYERSRLLDKGATASPGTSLLLPGEDAARINALLGCPWFTRAWTIQELVLASQVAILSDASELSWHGFIGGVIACAQRLPQIHAEAALALDACRRYYNGDLSGESGEGRVGGTRSFKYSFLELVELFFYAQSTHKRDRLFSLLGLAYDTTADKEDFYPDYSRLSDPSHDAVILSRYAKAFVQDSHVLDLLYRAGSARSCGFCTWIPDFLNKNRNTLYAPTISNWSAAGPSSSGESRVQDVDAEQHAFCADRFPAQAYVLEAVPTSLLSTQDYDIPVLAIVGRLVDTVKTCGTQIDSESMHFSNILRGVRNSISPLHGYPHWDPNSSRGGWKDKEDDILVRCLIGDAVGPHRGAFATRTPPADRWPEGYQTQALQAVPEMNGHDLLKKTDDEKHVISSYWETVAAFTGRIKNATACVTRRGYVGILPGTTRPGDRIFIPRGSRVPFVIMKRGGKYAGPAYYELVGECYVHGIMYSEAPDINDVQDEEVLLV